MKARTTRRRTPRRQGGGRSAVENRKTRALVLLANDRQSVSGLARKLGVSEVTVKRLIRELRRAGEEISSFRIGRRAYYQFVDSRTWDEMKNDPLFTTVVPAHCTHAPRGKAEDADYDFD